MRAEQHRMATAHVRMRDPSGREPLTGLLISHAWIGEQGLGGKIFKDNY